MDYLLVFIGIVFLVLGANMLIDGATGIAKRFHVSDMVIGLTIVALGTSLPEFVVTLFAAINNSAEIALTNVVGSNTVNTLLILGCSALFMPIKSDKSTRRFYIPLSLFAPILVFLLFYFGNEKISLLSGLILLAFFSLFLYSTVVRPLTRREERKTITENDNEAKGRQLKPQKKVWVSILLLVGGLLLLTAGGQMVVKGAVNLAKAWGVSEAVIGLTIVAIGTSLPELATSVAAAIKKKSDIALGNIIGSNIFNVFFVLGVSATIRPLVVYEGLWFDLFTVAFGSLLVMIFVYTNKKREIMRWQGFLLILCYFIYLFYLLSKILL